MKSPPVLQRRAAASTKRRAEDFADLVKSIEVIV
jgi:hypothetical protein